MSDQQVPTAPNYQPFVDAYNNLASYAQQHGTDALNWAKDQIANNTNLAGQVANGAVDMGNTLYGAGKTGLGQASDLVTQGIQNLKDQYAKYTDPARKAADMGAAGAQAAQGNEAARQASERELVKLWRQSRCSEFRWARCGSAGAGRSDESWRRKYRWAYRRRASRPDHAGDTRAGQHAGQTGTGQAQAGGALNTGALSGTLANTSSGYTGLGNGVGLDRTTEFGAGRWGECYQYWFPEHGYRR